MHYIYVIYVLYIGCKMQHTIHCMQNVTSGIIRLKKNVNECLHADVPQKIQTGGIHSMEFPGVSKK